MACSRGTALRADGCEGPGVGSRGKSTRALYPGEVARLARKICAPFWDGNCRTTGASGDRGRTVNMVKAQPPTFHIPIGRHRQDGGVMPFENNEDAAAAMDVWRA